MHKKVLTRLAGFSLLIGSAVFYWEMGKVDDHVLDLATQKANSFISETLMLAVVIFATLVMLYPIIISLSEEGFAAMHTYILLGVEIIAKFNWLESARDVVRADCLTAF